MTMVDRRLFCAGLISVAAAGGCSAQSPSADSERFAPVVPIQTTDYAAARAGFRTRLLRHGPSPQAQVMPELPKGAARMAFQSGDLSLIAWSAKPETVLARSPVVIFLHGGFAFGADDFEMATPYRDAGFIIFTPILRGEDGQAGSFSMFYDEVDDVIALVEHVRKLPYVDPDRIYLAGHSIGGTTAMLAAMASSHFRAVASLSGSADQILWIKAGGYSPIAPFDLNDPQEFIMRSPLSYATSFKAPARLYHGSEEAYFRPGTRKLADVAKAAGLDVVVQEFPGDHFGAVPAEISASIAFFRGIRVG